MKLSILELSSRQGFCLSELSAIVLETGTVNFGCRHLKIIAAFDSSDSKTAIAITLVFMSQDIDDEAQ